MNETNLIDYTKFRLKPREEIQEVFGTVAGIFIIYCNKCYKKFEREDKEEEHNKFLKILGEGAGKIVGRIGVDFLCNDFLSSKELLNLDLSGCDAVGVISCGIGVQFVAQLLEGKPVYALADSMQSANPTGGVAYHGVSLEREKCAGCDQCYLNLTGGICPIVNCPKGLLNGPCGGAKNGKCEVNPNIDCVWQEIYERFEKQGRKLTLESVQLRDYSKPSPKVKKTLSLQNQNSRGEGFYGGLHPSEEKEETKDKRLESFPEPEVAVIFLSQHTGKRARPLVKVGDKVNVGQKIGEADGFVSVPIHSSISGKVISIEERIHPTLKKEEPALIIKNDMENQLDSSIQSRKDFESLCREDLLEIIKEKGIVGLGGAMFPTHVKLSPPKNIDSLIVNGCECEPYLNGDNRIMIEHPEEILTGIKIVQKILQVNKVFIAAEDNKPEALASLSNLLNEPSNIEILSLKTKYPQGAEKVLIKRILNRDVPEKGLPLDVGVVVSNVSTIFAIYQAVIEGIPLIQRVMTVSGENLSKPGNYLVKLGTPFRDIAHYCMGEEELPNKYELKAGGPIMGISQLSLDSGVIKGMTGLTILKKPVVEVSEERDCIRCGRCVEACPMSLYPFYYAFYGKRGELEKAVKFKVENCIECGCCEVICSSKISILGFIKQEKEYARNSIKA